MATNRKTKMQTRTRVKTKTSRSVKDSKSKTNSKQVKAIIGLDGKIKSLNGKKVDSDVFVTDSFSNVWAKLGFGTDALLNKTKYPLTRMSYDYNLFNSLYRDNWVVQNIVGMIPEDMLKTWWKLKCDIDQTLIDRFNKVVRKTELKQKILKGLKWGRLYGGAVGIILLEGQDDLTQPLDLDSIQVDSFKGLFIVDRWNGVSPEPELIKDINDPEFGEPKFYNITNTDSGFNFKIHHSRIVKFFGRELPYIEKIAEQYWGSSEIESVYQEVIKRDNVSHNIANLTFRANLNIYEMEDLDQLFAVAGSEAQRRFWEMIYAQQTLESNFNTRLVKKGDNYRHEQYQFSGLPEVYDSVMMDVAGASHIPVTKLFGRSPAGMNATGESDQANYDDHIEKERETHLTPVIDKLLPIIAMSTFGMIPKDLDFEYNDVRPLKEEEKANVSNQYYSTLLNAFQSNAITRKTLLKELNRLSDRYDLFISLDKQDIENAEDKTLAELQQMQDPMAGLMGGVDENEEQTIEEQPMEGMDGQDNQDTIEQEDVIEDAQPDQDIEQRASILVDKLTEWFNKRKTNNKVVKPEHVAVIIEKDGKMLVGKRSDNGKWAGPGGHIENGETPLQAIVRETQEEVGSTPLNPTKIKVMEDGKCIVYYCNNILEEPTSSDELLDVQWVDKDKLDDLDLYEPFRDSLRNMIYMNMDIDDSNYSRRQKKFLDEIRSNRYTKDVALDKMSKSRSKSTHYDELYKVIEDFYK